MTKQILEKQNKDLRTRLENAAAKMDIERLEYQMDISNLKKQLKAKDTVIVTLQKEIKYLNESMEDRINATVKKAVTQAVSPLAEELSKAYTEIKRLKAVINKDSSNSSKPPSTNGFKTIPNNREKSGLPQGGQKGHKGHRLQLPENIEELEKKGIAERRIQDYTSGSDEYVSRFVIDIETKVIITEHRYKKDTKLPKELYNEVSYGKNIKATTVLLMNEGIIAFKRLSEIINCQTHGVINLSTGTVDRFQKEFAEGLICLNEICAIKQDLLNGDVMNTDDTHLRTLERIVYSEDNDTKEFHKFERAEKKSFNATMRTHSNEQSTLYTVNPKKDIKGIERDGILPQYLGALCHDHEAKFYNYGKNNGTCCEHLCRDLIGLRDLNKCSWAEEMRVFMLGMNTYKKNDLVLGILACDPKKLHKLESEYDEIVANGRKFINGMKKDEWGYSEINAMLSRLTKHKDNYMLFMRDYKIPFTNNLAERDLRCLKTKQKVSGLFRSWEGIQAYANIRSFISTTKKRGKDLLISIRQIFDNDPVFS